MEQKGLLSRSIADKYVIESYLGGGGMGAVYRARQAGLDKLVAIKILHPEFNFEPAFVARFKREAKAASRIDHPNSMRVLDFGQESDGLLYIVMEYLNGRSLHDILRDEAPLEPARIVELFRQVLAALAAAHDLGIVHRDLKPDNIVVLKRSDDEGLASEHVKVCDFGIAKFTASSQATAAEKLTTDGTIIGTPDYLSPEQARAETIDARSDLYSVGVILFEALTGRIPFEADTPLGIVLQHIDAQPPRPSTILPGVDARLEAICLRCLQKTPEDRYASAREMRSALAPDGFARPAPRRRVRITPAKEPGPVAPQLTPPPVSSTPPPMPILLTKKAARELRKRPRISEVGPIPESSSAPGVALAVVIVLAVLGVGAWIFRGAGPGLARPMAPASAPPPAPSLVVDTIKDAGVSFSAGRALPPFHPPLIGKQNPLLGEQHLEAPQGEKRSERKPREA